MYISESYLRAPALGPVQQREPRSEQQAARNEADAHQPSPPLASSLSVPVKRARALSVMGGSAGPPPLEAQPTTHQDSQQLAPPAKRARLALKPEKQRLQALHQARAPREPGTSTRTHCAVRPHDPCSCRAPRPVRLSRPPSWLPAAQAPFALPQDLIVSRTLCMALPTAARLLANFLTGKRTSSRAAEHPWRCQWMRDVLGRVKRGKVAVSVALATQHQIQSLDRVLGGAEW